MQIPWSLQHEMEFAGVVRPEDEITDDLAKQAMAYGIDFLWDDISSAEIAWCDHYGFGDRVPDWAREQAAIDDGGYPNCEECHDPIDYCQGHGELPIERIVEDSTWADQQHRWRQRVESVRANPDTSPRWKEITLENLERIGRDNGFSV